MQVIQDSRVTGQPEEIVYMLETKDIRFISISLTSVIELYIRHRTVSLDYDSLTVERLIKQQAGLAVILQQGSL